MLFAILPLAITPVAAHPVNSPLVIPLIAGQHYIAGYIRLWGGYEPTQHIQIICNPGWKITELHIAVAPTCDALPRNPSGKLVPGQFEYKYTYDPAASQTGIIDIELPFTIVSPDSICIAVHAVVIKTCGDRIVGEETAWGGEWKGCFT